MNQKHDHLLRQLDRLDREIERVGEEHMIATLTSQLAFKQRSLIDRRAAVRAELNKQRKRGKPPG
jgi:hypothetical protein